MSDTLKIGKKSIDNIWSLFEGVEVMLNPITDYLSTYYEELEPVEFYRLVFGTGELQEQGIYGDGKFNAIAVEVTNTLKKNGKPVVKRHTITDDLLKIDELCERDNFCLMSPISYVGKERNSDNARVLYALAIDLDGIKIKNDTPVGLYDLIHQMKEVERLPVPSVIVSSGTGIHLYYIFNEPINLYPNVVKQLQKYKRELTRLLWHGYITNLEDNVQYESLFQGFRVVGTITKKGERAKAYLVGEKVTMDYMNSFVDEKFRTGELVYKSKLSLAEAKKKYPSWYQNRVIEKQKKGTWTCNRAVYEWWKNRIHNEAKTGHRYFCMMMLSVYARKCGISREELESDAFEIMEQFDRLTTDLNNRFNERDVLDALQAFDDRFMTFPISSISYLTDIKIEKNKRNGRKQKEHLRDKYFIDENGRNIRNQCKLHRDARLEDMRENGEILGRPSKKDVVQEWKKFNPNKRKIDCYRETGIDPKTIRKWWNE